MSLFRGERLLDHINSSRPEKHLVASIIACVLERRYDSLDQILVAVEEHGLEQSASHFIILEVALRLSAFYESLPRSIVVSIFHIATASDRAAAEFSEFLATVQIHETEDGVRLNINEIDAAWWPPSIPLNS